MAEDIVGWVAGIIVFATSIAVAIVAAAVWVRKEEKRRKAETARRAEESRLQKAVWLREEKAEWERGERERAKRQAERRLDTLAFNPVLIPTVPSGNTPKHTMYGRQEGVCVGCLRHFPFRNMTTDHIVPRANGGTDHPDNLQLLCNACNSDKGALSQAEFIARLVRDGIRPT